MTSAEAVKELAEALGDEVANVRIRQNADKNASVIDVICLFPGQKRGDAAHTLQRLWERHPEIRTRCSRFKFPGRGQKDMPVCDLANLHRILMILPGRQAAQGRQNALQLLLRFLSLSQPPLPTSDPSEQHLYVMESQGLLKIGRSCDVLRRLRQLSGSLGTHHLVEVFEGEGALEPYLHWLLREKRVQGEYFDVTLDEIRAALPRARQVFQEELAHKTEPSLKGGQIKRKADCLSWEERRAALERSKAKLATKEAFLARKQARVAKAQAKLAKEQAQLARERARLAEMEVELSA
jgi:hypothetical protein